METVAFVFFLIVVILIFKELKTFESYQPQKIVSDIKVKFPTPMKELPVTREVVLSPASGRRLFPERSVVSIYSQPEYTPESKLVNLRVDTNLNEFQEADWALSPLTPSPNVDFNEKWYKIGFKDGYRSGFKDAKQKMRARRG